MRIGWLFLALALALAPAAPAGAQVTCRTNALGASVCTGVPAPSLRARDPYVPPRDRGLGALQAPPRANQAGPKLAPARAVDILGPKILLPGDLPPRRPPLPGVAPVRDCNRDSFGNLICR